MLPDDTRRRPESILDQFRRYTWWFTPTRWSSSTPGWRRDVLDSPIRAQRLPRDPAETLPAEHLFGRRLEMMTLAVMSQLRPRGKLVPDRARMGLRRRAADRARPPEAAYYAGRR